MGCWDELIEFRWAGWKEVSQGWVGWGWFVGLDWNLDLDATCLQGWNEWLKVDQFEAGLD